MEKLINTLPRILAAAGGSEEVAEAACVAAWKHAVGEALSNHAVPVRLDQKTLVIAVRDNIWKKQLEHLRAQLLFRLNAILGQQVVKLIEISVQPDVFKSLPDPGKTSAGDFRARTEAVPIELISAASEIPDASLRRAFLGAAVSCVNRLEKKKSSTTSDI